MWPGKLGHNPNMRKNTNLMSDNRGVSPVVGVVLLVGITVVLAVTVGALVLNTGQNVADSLEGPDEPNVSVSFTADNVTVTHVGGESVPASNVVVAGDVEGGQVKWDEYGTVSKGDSLTLDTTDKNATVYVLLRDKFGEETLLEKAEN